MLGAFQNFIAEHHLFNRDHKLLLALSGGADSVCLFHLLLEGGYNFSVAHCNFKLRADESDDDEAFVINLAKSKSIPCHTISFDTNTICEKEGTGIQETARKLRYDWFASLMRDHGYDKLLTAHHLTDNLETMLIHILRGTGISGLHGIPLDEGDIARPLMFATRRQVEEYLLSGKITWREDKSNETDNYLRNAIRHKVLPALLETRPDAETRFFETAQKIKTYESMTGELIAQKWTILAQKEGEAIRISMDGLKDIESKALFLYYNMRPYGFNLQQIENIIDSVQAGKKVMSEKYGLVIERGYFILKPLKAPESDGSGLVIDEAGDDFRLAGWSIDIKIKQNTGFTSGNMEKGRVMLDAGKVGFPFRIRAWKDGDRLKPLGMKGTKKVSDILTDRKVESHLRKSFIVVEKYDNEVIALLPDIIHDNYKVSAETQSILSIGIKIA